MKRVQNYRIHRIHRPGFTLIELLTVIAIIGILAAILIPVVGRVRESARQAVCASNLRQITMGMLVYATEHDGRLPAMGSAGSPHVDDWVYWQAPDDRNHLRHHSNSALMPYVGGAVDVNLFRCPTDLDYQNYPYQYSYAMNSAIAREPHGHADDGRFPMGFVDRVLDPTRIVMMLEEGGPGERFGGKRNDAVVILPGDKLGIRHGDRGNVSFMDGHVELVSKDFLRQRENVDPRPPSQGSGYF
jgi:prepilin-type N-terminal cleavage/methylation domain-containing protein/prepilin-type processing-associated H-X9-DG protein